MTKVNCSCLPPHRFDGSCCQTKSKSKAFISSGVITFAVATLFVLFAAFGFAKSTDQAEPVPFVHTSKVTYYITPFQAEGAEASFIEFIHNQKKEICMNAYGLTDSAVCDALIERKKAGVEIHITMDGTQAAGTHQAPLVEKLRHAGIEVLVGKSPDHDQLLHAKLTIGDEKNTELGSWNFSPSASEQFNDLIYVLDDAVVAKHFKDAWQQIYQHLAAKAKH